MYVCIHTHIHICADLVQVPGAAAVGLVDPLEVGLCGAELDVRALDDSSLARGWMDSHKQ